MSKRPLACLLHRRQHVLAARAHVLAHKKVAVLLEHGVGVLAGELRASGAVARPMRPAPAHGTTPPAAAAGSAPRRRVPADVSADLFGYCSRLHQGGAGEVLHDVVVVLGGVVSAWHAGQRAVPAHIITRTSHADRHALARRRVVGHNVAAVVDGLLRRAALRLLQARTSENGASHRCAAKPAVVVDHVRPHACSTAQCPHALSIDRPMPAEGRSWKPRALGAGMAQSCMKARSCAHRRRRCRRCPAAGPGSGTCRC